LVIGDLLMIGRSKHCGIQLNATIPNHPIANESLNHQSPIAKWTAAACRV
jgi:hypothetical protein